MGSLGQLAHKELGNGSFTGPVCRSRGPRLWYGPWRAEGPVPTWGSKNSAVLCLGNLNSTRGFKTDLLWPYSPAPPENRTSKVAKAKTTSSNCAVSRSFPGPLALCSGHSGQLPSGTLGSDSHFSKVMTFHGPCLPNLFYHSTGRGGWERGQLGRAVASLGSTGCGPFRAPPPPSLGL